MTVNTFIDLGNGWVFDWGFTLFMVTYFLVAMELNRYEHPSALSLRIRTLVVSAAGNQFQSRYTGPRP